MSPLHEPIKRARRRLWFNRWLGALGWCLAMGAGVFTVGIVVDRVFGLTIDGGPFYGLLIGGVMGLVLIGSMVWAAAKRDSLETAAAELDIAAGLKERLSSGLYCERSADPFARAVVEDAESTSRRITVGKHLPVRVPRSANYAGGTLVIALLAFWLFPMLDLGGRQAVAEEKQQQQEAVRRAEAAVKPLVEKQVEEMKERNPDLKKDLDQLLQPMEQARIEKPLDVRTEQMKRIEQLREKLDKKRSDAQLSMINEFKKMLRPMASEKNETPVGQLAESLAKGDFESAKKAMEALKLELAKAPQTPEEKQRSEEMQQQLKNLSDKLNKLADANKQATEELKKAGLNEEDIKKALENLKKEDVEAIKKQLAEKGIDQQQIQKMMQEMQKQAAASKQMNKLAQNMAKAAQGEGSEGQAGEMSAEALQGFAQAAQQLSDMEQLEQQLQQLNAAMGDLQAMKDQMGQGCKECQGSGTKDGKPCPGCKGSGMGGQFGDPNQQGGGMGQLGRGQGGIAPKDETNTNMVERRTPVKTVPGRIISQKYVDGEQYKGEVSPEIIEVTKAAEREVSDAIKREQIPRVYHSGIKEYFTRSQEGLPAEPIAGEDTGDGP